MLQFHVITDYSLKMSYPVFVKKYMANCRSDDIQICPKIILYSEQDGQPASPANTPTDDEDRMRGKAMS